MNCAIIIDVGCLAHRAYHAVGGLSFDDEPTGVLFGIFRDVQNLRDRFLPDVFAFCFDGEGNKRRELLSTYKTKRHEQQDEDEQERRKVLYRQIARLPSLLEAMGYNNIFKQDGYEADDLIAAVCKQRYAGQNIIISSDHDLWQLLRKGTVMWSPHSDRVVKRSTILDEHSIDPCYWWRVLAIAGCNTDDVPGVRGVGVKTAIKYLNGELGKHTVKYKAIQAAHAQICDNVPLVHLPFAGVRVPVLVPDDATDAAWDAVVGDLGMDTLLRGVRR